MASNFRISISRYRNNNLEQVKDIQHCKCTLGSNRIQYITDLANYDCYINLIPIGPSGNYSASFLAPVFKIPEGVAVGFRNFAWAPN